MRAVQTKLWYLLHKWTSLICTAFLLQLCLTGLPLIFSDEIGDWLDPTHFPTLAPDAPTANIDDIVEAARQTHLEKIVLFVAIDDENPQVVVAMADSWDSAALTPLDNRLLQFDSRTAALLRDSQPLEAPGLTAIQWILRLHTDLFAGLPGALFLGAMGSVFLMAIVSGVILYAPFMRKLGFGTLRRARSPQTLWLDWHNFLGIATVAWTLAVGATGVMNELSAPLYALWQRTDVREMLAEGADVPPTDQGRMISLQGALDRLRAASPDRQVFSIFFPGAPQSTPHHFAFWAKGDKPVTSHLFSPTLVEAENGEVTATLRMPWYLQALQMSRPLHFGDYGGLPLKILWALLDIAAIVVLGSGLYLWFAKRKPPLAVLLDEIKSDGTTEAPTGKRP